MPFCIPSYDIMIALKGFARTSCRCYQGIRTELTCIVERQDAIKKNDICALHRGGLRLAGASHKVILGYGGRLALFQILQGSHNLAPCKCLHSRLSLRKPWLLHAKWLQLC